MKERFKRGARFLDDGKVEFRVDPFTIVVKEFDESQIADWPELADQERPKPKRKRRKVKNDAQGDAEPDSVRGGI